MGRYDRTDAEDRDIQSRGIDSDLESAIEYNPQPYAVEDIERVLACVPGEHDAANWHWIIELKQPRLLPNHLGQEVLCKFVYATGGCDYTGWD
jgi:hypothetical protein